MPDLEPRVVADICINLFGAMGAVIVSRGLATSNPHSPVALRIRVALWLVAALFVSRCIAWASDNTLVATFSQLIALTLPVAAIIATEGMLRRHAPRNVKLAITAMSLVAALLLLAPGLPQWLSTCATLLAVGGGFGLATLLLVRRDKATLSPAENTSIVRAIWAMCLLLPFILTDFHALMPNAPLRAGALGTLLLLFLAFAPSGTEFRTSERILAVMLFAGIGGIFALGYAASVPHYEPEQVVRAASVGLAGLLVSALFFELLGARAERRKSADPLLQAHSASDFLDRLGHHEAIGNVRSLGDAELAPLRHADFDSLLAEHPVLRLSDAPWRRPASDHGTERARSLLRTHDATHALVLQSNPYELVVFHVPPSTADARLESEINVAQRIGTLLFSRAEVTQ